MTPESYLAIRRKHLVFSLRTLSERQKTAIVAIAMVLGPGVVGGLEAASRGIEAFVAPETSIGVRLALYLPWLAATTLLVFALREPVYMLGARPFLRSLPIRKRAHLAGDLASIAAAYSILWLPVAYFIWNSATRNSRGAIAGGAILAGAIFAGMLLQALAVDAWHRRRSHGEPVHGGRRLAIASGLALPLLLHDLRAAALLRLGALAATGAAGAALAWHADVCAKAWGIHLVQCALAVLFLQRLPALVDERLRESLPFVFRLRAARLRALAFSGALMLTLYAAAATASVATWQSACGMPAARLAVAATLDGLALLALAGVAVRWARASGWISMLAMLAVSLAIGQSL